MSIVAGYQQKTLIARSQVMPAEGLIIPKHFQKQLQTQTNLYHWEHSLTMMHVMVTHQAMHNLHSFSPVSIVAGYQQKTLIARSQVMPAEGLIIPKHFQKQLQTQTNLYHWEHSLTMMHVMVTHQAMHNLHSFSPVSMYGLCTSHHKLNETHTHFCAH